MLKIRLTATIAAIFIALMIVGCQAEKAPEAGKGSQAAVGETAKGTSAGGKVVAEIGKEKITLEDLDQMIKDLPEQYQQIALSRKDMFADTVVTQKLLYNEAVKQNLDKDAKVKKEIEQIAREIAIREYLKKEIEDKVTVSDEEAKKFYDANKDKFKEPEKIKVFHILVDNEAAAKDILAKLKGGADFAALAKEKSKCPSKDRGGDLGFMSKGQAVPEFEQAAVGLQAGQMSDVVKTQFGYHIIKVEERQPERTASFDESKDQLKQMLLSDKQKQTFDTLIKDLKDKNKVVIHNEILQPPAEDKPAETKTN